MSEITLDSTSLSDQLGLYDFFNVFLSGATLVFGLCVLNDKIYGLMWNNISVLTGLYIILLVYATGICIQELATYIDNKFLKIYMNMSHSVLYDLTKGQCTSMLSRYVLRNSMILERYRKNALRIIDPNQRKKKCISFNDYETNGLVFSVYQYKVLVCGKDKKVEKLRALFDLSLSLMMCFFVLFISSFLSLFTDTKISPIISGLFDTSPSCSAYITKMLLVVICICLCVLFYGRAIRTMRNFLLILYGTANAILEEEFKENDEMAGDKS